MSRITKPWIMTLEQVKSYLQITGTDYDAAIAVYLPVVTRDIELITNNSFIVESVGDLAESDDVVANIATEMLEVGNVVCAENFVQNAITDVDDESETIVLATASDATVADADLLINIFPEAKKPIAAAMVMYNIKKYTADVNEQGPLKSERVGSYSWTAANDGKGAAGYPQWMVDGIKEITRPRFY